MQTLCIELLVDVQRDVQKRYAIILFLIRMDYSGELQKYRAIHRQRKQANVGLFRHYFERALGKGQLAPQHDPVTLAMAVRCYLKGIVFEYLDDPDTFDMSAQAPILIRTFFHALIARTF
jgi:hypothetical protein